MLVPEMTYYVSGGTLNLTHSPCIECSRFCSCCTWNSKKW